MNLLSSIAKNIPSLKKAEIAGVLYLIKNTPNISNNELIRFTGIPKEELRRFKSTISELLEDSNSEQITFSSKGLSEIEQLNLIPYDWSIISLNTPEKAELISKLKNLREKHKLHPKREYDQWFATEETSINKSLILKNKDCIEDKKIALLGDDDLVSTVLPLLKIDYSKITVIDVDQSLLNTIKGTAETNGYKNIETIQLDVRKELPGKLFQQFDVVVLDPPYTKSGVTLFLNKAIELLNGSNKYIFLYYGNSFKSPEKTLKIQEIINRMGLLIEDKIDKFSRYYGAESIGSASSLYILKTTPHTSTVLTPKITTDIYTFENQSEEKFPFVDHITAKINKVPSNIFRSKHTLLSLLQKFCEAHKLKVVDTFVTDFKNGGLTITFVLSNSNFVIHTWPEYNALHFDLITCSPIYKKENISDTISSLFNSNFIELNYID